MVTVKQGEGTITVTGDASVSFISNDGKSNFTIHGENQDTKVTEKSKELEIKKEKNP